MTFRISDLNILFTVSCLGIAFWQEINTTRTNKMKLFHDEMRVTLKNCTKKRLQPWIFVTI
jgi:hypothetical protein